jgi:hypothetical protein
MRREWVFLPHHETEVVLMHGRRHGRKPTLALWMLVAIADLAILATAVGAEIIVTTLIVLVGVAATARILTGSTRRTTHARRRA